MDTEKLYDRDAFLKEFDAVVTDCRPGKGDTYLVTLDRTAFYPEGGGQPADHGDLGGAAVLDAAGAEEQPVYAAIRPEGFVPAEDGPLCCKLDRVEVMGRDISVVCTHPDCENAVIRAIITADSRVDTTRESIRFALKPHKVFLFHRDTQVRLDCTLR